MFQSPFTINIAVNQSFHTSDKPKDCDYRYSQCDSGLRNTILNAFIE